MILKESTSRLACLIALGAAAAALAACESTAVRASRNAGVDPGFGVMVMAHGGNEAWNSHVLEALEPLKSRYPVEVAFGMADAGSIEAAAQRLESHGVRHVGVVRLFISGESWYDRTLQILGLRDGAPARADADHSRTANANMPMPMGFWKLDTELDFHVNVDGLADAEEMDEVLTARIRALSSDPDNEVAAVIAHGPGDDGENQRWIEKIAARTQDAQEELGLRDIRVFTLREDWPDSRTVAERQIRNFVSEANSRGLTPIVVPFRVQGFGPYERVLDGLDYRADKVGLLPHPNVGLWIAGQAELMQARARDSNRKLADNPR